MSTKYAIYIPYVFGQDSDALTPFTNATDPDGGISMDQGYTPPYQYNLSTNPEALPISRGQFNYLMNVITANIQQYQQKGLPEWIDPAQNGGVNFPYQINAQVFYGTSIYKSVVDSNTSVPGTDDNWLNISGSVDNIQIGMTLFWPTYGAPAGNYLFCDGSAISRTTYSQLFDALCPILTGNIANTSDTITGLDDTSDIAVGCHIVATGFASGTVVLAVINSTSIQVSNSATASATGENIQFFPWGIGDGSTTFNVPSFTSQYLAGAGGAGIAWAGETYSGVGASLGNEDYQAQLSDIPDHNHDPEGNSTDLLSSNGSGFGTIGYGSSGNNLVQQHTTGGITGFTSQTNIPQIPPTKLVKMFIKYS